MFALYGHFVLHLGPTEFDLLQSPNALHFAEFTIAKDITTLSHIKALCPHLSVYQS
uniref:Uncharacterized protein n=1 Tax=Anguilla anguilla TaxID=7936 RepID=A0A0E9TGU6_ANGAN